MQFVDEVTVEVFAGNGGNGCVAFRHEKFVPLGGPSGGDGGKGADIIFQAQSRMSTLLDLRFRRELRAQSGEQGRGKDQFGKGGDAMIVPVPVGTQVYDIETNALIADLSEDEQQVVIAKGGEGGRGNMRFATPFDRAPRRADKGGEGEHRVLRLELKLLADVGVIGFPNVGKSTFISAVSRAKPKIADYPFTTLVPNLGVVRAGEEHTFVIADIPGIIEGAADGAGLGLQFLRHVERNRVLFHVLSFDPDPERDPIRDFDILLNELKRYDPEVASRPMLVGVSKMDLPDVQEAFPEIEAEMKKRGIGVVSFSSATRKGVQEAVFELSKLLSTLQAEESEPQTKRPAAQERPHGDQKGWGPSETSE